ncbi:hypothetical protein KO494_15235 [Lacinutrix sp. C3R15]|uniref:hypothetical protein n=1 Tax=Flavobacteriaceae TaxID=49546 RepID=UPI001C09A985|nr:MULTISPECIES: hypothetical protein [Flavobacteriaceae]MBU2940902.1 hypothetical protein [Lacinutrix sp. C3R15]MDO6624221.1 hypothetical protein [Oceanihabitans sp. 1_MG-2023]
MKNLFYIFIFCFSSVIEAQNISEKTFLSKDISTININGENVFKITVEAKPVSEITVSSRVEGENNENVVIVTENSNNNLYIAARKQPLFKDANDKLSAHKVISIEITLVVPENLQVFLNAYNALVVVQGHYKKVRVNAAAGNCFFNAFYGDAKIYTRGGNIALQTNNATIVASSKNGTIKKEEIDTGANQIVIKTINGNITLTKSQ